MIALYVVGAGCPLGNGQGGPVYHSPHDGAGELPSRGLIPSRSRSCDVLDTRREYMSAGTQPPKRERMFLLSWKWGGRDGSEQVHDTESEMSQLGERIFSELSGFDLVSVILIPLRTYWHKLHMVRATQMLDIYGIYRTRLAVLRAPTSSCRGGTLDDDILDALDIATGRIRSLQAEALEIAKDIADIQGMVRSRKRARQPSSPEREHTPQRPRPSKAPSPEKSLSPAGSGGAAGSEMEPCRTFKIRASDRARRSYDIGYLCDLDTVGDLHFEYARVSRRGASGFCLIQDGTRLKGAWKLGRIDDKTAIMAPTHDGESLGSLISCKRRGGSPSSIRSKIARKALQSHQPSASLY